MAARLFFLLYQYKFSFDISFSEWLLTFVYGIRLDISSVGYILAITGLILTATFLFSGKIIHKILKPFTLFVFAISSIIIVVDLELYKNWGYRMDATPLLYITKPKEAMASTEWWLIIFLMIFIVLLIFIGNYVYNKLLKPKILAIKQGNIVTFFLLLFLTGTMILPIRASFGIAPVNTGMVYFSQNKFANHTAVNVVWNVMHSLLYRKNAEKTYHFMPDEKAEHLVKKLSNQSGETLKVLKTSRPNIVIIILESFSNKVIGALNGEWDSTPNFNELAKEGLLFTNFYANGDRSDKGIVSILSGYPAQPTTSIIKTSSKTESLPYLFKNFNKLGYESWFYYGGDIDFANMRSYFLNGEVQHLVTGQQFDKKLRNSKWGVHDEHLFTYLYENMFEAEEPFFKVVFTLSSHDPFDVPMEPVFKGNDRATKFRNSIYYTDRCLGNFFRKIKKTEIWDSTLFILLADHGSPRPGNSQNHELDKFHIPMLWIGGALKTEPMIINKPGSQTDVPNTLLSQISSYDSSFTYSNNLMNQNYHGFVFYAFNDGFGFITDSTKVVYDNVGKHILYEEGNEILNDLEKGKAFLQVLSNDFIKR
ncbi:MAG: sulfatase-like hydrolase/transferase [Bacteroidota bacterium]|nr:sulfatase-like hydrolase/transferase [Bacteroidota bacterium]